MSDQMITDPRGDLLLKAQEEFNGIASSLTGQKKQLMDMGWSEAIAESLVLEILTQSDRDTP